MRKLWSLLLVLTFFLAACGGEKEEETPAASLPARLQEIQKSGKLVVGTAITRPFEYRDPETNELIGFDISLIEKIADKLDVSIEWREMAFADLLGELQAGNVDMVIAGMYITPAREEIIDFSQPYLSTGLVMAVQADNTSIISVEDLSGQLVGVKEGSTGERWAERVRTEQGVEMELQRYSDTLDSLEDLETGVIQVVLNDRINTLEYIKTHPGIRIQGDVLEPAGLGIAVKTGDSELLTFINATLDELRTQGELDKLFNEWINPETAR